MTSAISALSASPRARLVRAGEDLRAGRGIAIIAPERVVIGIAGERTTGGVLAALWSLGTPHLALSRRRATYLRLRLYGEGAALLPAERGWTAPFIAGLCDAAKDAQNAIRGPLTADRASPPAEAEMLLSLARASGLLPAVLFLTLPREEGLKAAWAAGLAQVEADDLKALRAEEDRGDLELVTSARLPISADEKTRIYAFRSRLDRALPGEPEAHYAIVIGEPVLAHAPLVRLHSECFTGDLLGSLKCDCGDQLRGALGRIAESGAGVLLYLRQEGRGIGLLNKLRAYHLQDEGYDTVEANERLGFADDERSFGAAAAVLTALGLTRIRLLTNNPRKVDQLSAFGIHVTERVQHDFPANPHNAHYLETKRAKSGHFL